MKTAYLIDPFTHTVEQVERTAPTGTVEELQEIYGLLGCDCIEAVHPENAGTDVIYIDENGKINGNPEQEFFYCRLWPHEPLAGRGLWTGATPEGNDTDPHCSLAYVRAHIVWSQRI